MIDPLLTSIYNLITGSHAKAPVGSIFNWINQSLLTLEGRGSMAEIVRTLLKDYQAKQSAAERDLRPTAGLDTDALLTANAHRETAFLLKIKAVSNPGDGLAGLLHEIEQSTNAVAARHHGKADGTGQGNGNGGPNVDGKHGQPKPKK